MGLAVSEWSQPFVIFLSCRIPQRQLYGFAVYSTVGHVILKHRGYVALDLGQPLSLSIGEFWPTVGK